MQNKWKVRKYDLWVTECADGKYCIINDANQVVKRGFESFDTALQEAAQHGKMLGVHISKTNAPKYIRVKGQLYIRTAAKKSDLEVMAADFGVPPEKVADLKKYKDERGVSFYDAISEKI